MKLCAHCKDEFEPKRTTAKFCSPKCRVADGRVFKRAGTEVEAPESLVVGPMPVAPEGKFVDEDTGVVYDKDPNPFAESNRDPNYDYAAAEKAFMAMGLHPVDWITTGIPEFDALTRIPRGRVTQIQGPYAVGKTTLCLNMVKGLRDVRVLYIDTEAALDYKTLMKLNINPKTFRLYNDSAFIEDIYDTILRALEKPQFDIIILDSLAACTFRVEAAGAGADANIGQKAKIVGKLMRVAPMELKRTNTALVIINQEREVIGGYAPIKYTPGGMGVPYAASLMVSLKTTKGARFPKSGPPFKGHEVTAEIIKSKVNTPWRKATFKLFYAPGAGS